jgi:glyoxylase-like metal-dependent hydrolase (beta-lactamase superfamily II)
MKLIPLEIGRLEASLSIITGEDTTATLPIPSWLVEHPDGLLLFDTGLHPDLRHGTERIGRAARFFAPDFPAGEELAARLVAAGVRPSDITHIVFSHLHFDHVGGTAEIPDARIIVQADEWTAGNDPRLIEKGAYMPDDYVLGHDVQTITGLYDVFGDGSVICVPTPGHTIGHQSLRVELESGPVVLTGDCIYFDRMLTEMRVPTFGYDTDQQRDSMLELRRLRDVEGCRLLYGHDVDQFRALDARIT